MKFRIWCPGLALLLTIGPLMFALPQQGESDQGIDAVEVIDDTATVEKIDLEKRKVTLLMDNGKKQTYKVDKSVQDLDRVRVGDHLNISYTEEVMMMVGGSDQAPGAATLATRDGAPSGSKPVLVEADTSVITVKILGVDPEKHRVTFEDPGGKKKTIKVSKKYQHLDELQPGSTVDMLLAESLVVRMAK